MDESCAKTTNSLTAFMISCARSPSYVNRTIRSFRLGSDMALTVFVDGDYPDYCGNVAVVLSSWVVKNLLSAAERSDAPSDMLVKDLVWSTKTPLRQTVPNLAQHFGDVSTTGVERKPVV